VIAPLFLAADNYLLLGRLLLSVLPSTSSSPIPKIFRISATMITKIFVGCDVFSFLIQVSGSGIASSNNWKGDTKDIGVNVLIVGLATQLLAMLVFLSVVARFCKRASWEGEVRQDPPAGWQKVLTAVIVSCTLIVVSVCLPYYIVVHWTLTRESQIRSIYRLIEFALGVDGYLFSHEWPFYVFESLPMMPAIAVFCFWYPGRILPKKKVVDDREAVIEERKAVPDRSKSQRRWNWFCSYWSA
jgi:hypothetical protein